MDLETPTTSIIKDNSVLPPEKVDMDEVILTHPIMIATTRRMATDDTTTSTAAMIKMTTTIPKLAPRVAVFHFTCPTSLMAAFQVCYY